MKALKGSNKKTGPFQRRVCFDSSELPHEQKKKNNNPLVTQAGHVFMKIKYQLKVKLNEKKKVKHAC